MADTKISALSAVASVAAANELVVNEAGTSKKATAAQLKTFCGVATDALWDAAGDLALGSGADTAVRLAVSTTAGQAVTADPAATNKLAWLNPISVGEAYSGTTGCLLSMYNRNWVIGTVVSAVATSGTLRLWGMPLPKGLPITNISFWSGTQALSVGLNQWFGVFDVNRNVLAKTADDTSTAWGSNVKKTLAITGGPYVVPSSGFYYIGILIKATTIPNIESVAVANVGTRNTAPVAGGNSTVGLTDPASCTGQQTAITVLSHQAYCEMS